jgi:hypothetical protein
MAIDWEKRFYEEVSKIDKIKDDIEDIKEDIGELQSSYKKLKRSINLQGVQEQLNSLHDSFHDSLFETQRHLATIAIFSYALYLNLWVGKELSDSTSPTFSQASEFVKTKAEKAHDRAKKSKNPISIASQFMADSEEYFRIHDLEPYRGQRIL